MIVPYARMSHVGILVENLDEMIGFYSRVLGMIVSDRGKSPNVDREYAFLSRDPMEHHQIVFVTGRTPGVPSQIVQMSFELAGLPDLRSMHAIVSEDSGASAVQTRAHGIAWSLYFNDPENNIIETFVSTPWYVPAPSVIPFDFSMTDDEIFRSVRDKAKERPGYMTHNEWRGKAQQRMLEAGVWPGP